MWEAIKQAIRAALEALGSMKSLAKRVLRGGRWVTEWTLDQVVKPVATAAVAAPVWLASTVAAAVSAPFRASTGKAPSEDQGVTEGQREIHRRLLAETPEAKAGAEALVNAERLRNMARRLADGAEFDKMHGFAARLPRDWRLWLKGLSRAQLLNVAETEPKLLAVHLCGSAPLPGLPPLATGAEAGRLGVAPEAVTAARRFEEWRNGRAAAPAPDARRRARRLTPTAA